MRYTGTDFRTGILGYLRKTHRQVPKFPEGKELLLTSMAATRDIEYTSPKYRRDIRSVEALHYVAQRQSAELMLMLLNVINLAGGTSNMSTLMKRHDSLLLLRSPVGSKGKANKLVRISLYAVFYTGVKIEYRYANSYGFLLLLLYRYTAVLF